jgi:hypothetical protein
MLAIMLALSATAGFAEEPPAYPSQVFWGDTHVHTDLSQDAFIMGTRLTPEDAYRFAKGDPVRATGGGEVQLRRPLDFLMVADHAENLGLMPMLAARDDALPKSDAKQQWEKIITELPILRDVLNADTIGEFQRGFAAMVAARPAGSADYQIGDDLRRSVWEDVIAVAEKHNSPGTFTTFIGYEWTSEWRQTKPKMIHRNVLFADGADLTSQVLPFSRFDSNDVEDLWNYLQDYEDRIGGNVIAIPHNGNLSGGGMFSLKTFLGEPFTGSYAKNRVRWEPIYEVTQTKGDGETHPLLSPDDAFADFETWPPPAMSLPLSKAAKGKSAGKTKVNTPTKAVPTQQHSYARAALKLGLDQQRKLGSNPFKFGMIGSTDSHTGLAAADEDAFWLKEPSRYRTTDQWYYSGQGYAAVWATENTRASLFAAMKRKETYATTGPRMVVRFFGGWNFTIEDAKWTGVDQAGYSKGVPMGGDLTNAPNSKSPRFLVLAVKDPDGANLDRIQIIKGWRSNENELHEKVFNVARSVDTTIGGVELSTVWEDPEFDENESAFYYARVLQIPTPRWTAYDAKRFELKNVSDQIPMVIQERAYTSPIWYTP